MRARLGTRGSALALAQAAAAAGAVAAAGLECEIVSIRTHGDRHPDRPASLLGIGAFVKELEGALIDRRIDLAVHSAKDLPGGETAGVTMAAFLPREDPLDVIVTRSGCGLLALPADATVGTDSPRRRAFLLAARPDLRVASIRGNVGTRLRKLESGEVDAIVLAAAGLARLGLRMSTCERLDPSVMLPAVGQGAVVIQCRVEDSALLDLLGAVDHHATRTAVVAERSLLEALGGGCQRPIAALAICGPGALEIEGAVLDPDGTCVVRDSASGPTDDPRGLGAQLAGSLVAQGAGRLLEGATR